MHEPTLYDMIAEAGVSGSVPVAEHPAGLLFETGV
jgi:hypothetical protein